MDAQKDFGVWDRIALLLAGDALQAREILSNALARHVLRCSRLGTSPSSGMSLGLELILDAESLNRPSLGGAPGDLFLLVATHGPEGTFSYSRLAQELRLPESEVPERLNRARVRYAWAHQLRFQRWVLPLHESCPEYEDHSPWMQKFLDEELSHQTLRMISTHIQNDGCEQCRERLNRYRQFYYEIQKHLTQKVRQLEDQAQMRGVVQSVRIQAYERVLKEGLRLTRGIRVQPGPIF